MTNAIANLSVLMHGIAVTCILMVFALVIGAMIAFVLNIFLFSKNIFLKNFARVLIFFITGTPLLVQIFLIYYGLGQFDWLRATWAWYFLREPFVCAILAFSLNTGCYTAVILQGAIRSVPTNEIAAAYALGMRRWQTYRRIILPRAITVMLPAYSNEMILVLKSTSLASTITILDVMGVIQNLISQTYDTLYWYLIAAIIYLALTALLMSIYRLLERLMKYSSY